MSGYEVSFDILRSALYSISFHNQLNKKIDFAPYLLNKLSNHETSFYSEFLSLLLTSHFCVVAGNCVTYVCLTTYRRGTARTGTRTTTHIVHRCLLCCGRTVDRLRLAGVYTFLYSDHIIPPPIPSSKKIT